MRSLIVLPALVLSLALGGCGDESNTASPPATGMLSGTLAYGVSSCRENADGFFLRVAVLIRQGEREPISVMEVPEVGPFQRRGLCRFVGANRHGANLADWGPLHVLAVSPDGSAVAFQLSDEFHPLGDNLLTSDQRGMFLVRADGTGLRRLGPATRERSYRFDWVFTPDGRGLVFPDLGPGPDGTESSQLFVLDLASGRRTQLTRLPRAVNTSPEALCCPFFLDEQTIVFQTTTNPDGLNPSGVSVSLIVSADGSGRLRVPPTVTDASGGMIDPRFSITGEPSTLLLPVPGQPENGGPQARIHEIFIFDGDQNLLQITNFRRADTRSFGGRARDRVLFIASADPLGTNPSNNCQVFSMSSLGDDPRQLTQFYEVEHSRTPCNSGSLLGSGCLVSPFGRDVNNGTLLFHSSCNPFGRNPNGHQLFALGEDGNGLRQLTDLRGFVIEPDGTVIAELPFPFAYPGPQSE